jgi:HEAT repeat protein
LAAAQSLGQYADRAVGADLIALLDDPWNAVRAAAATALLGRLPDVTARLGPVRERLLAYQWMGEGTRDWARVSQLGDAARPALQIALQDDDLVVRREAAAVSQYLDGRHAPAARTPMAARVRRTKTLARLLGRA